MATMNVSLPESLKEFVDHKVTEAGYGTASEYVRELIRRDQDRARLRNMLLKGARASLSGNADADYFAGLRAGIRSRAEKAA